MAAVGQHREAEKGVHKAAQYSYVTVKLTLFDYLPFRLFMSLAFSSRVACAVTLALFVALPLSARADAPPKSDGTRFTGIEIYSNARLNRAGIGVPEPQTTLDVAGEIKPSSSGAACAATIAGALRYASGKLQLCDGNSWRNLALEPAK